MQLRCRELGKSLQKCPQFTVIEKKLEQVGNHELLLINAGHFFKEGENPEHRFSLFLFALFFLTSTIITNLVVRVTTSLCAIADDIFTDTFITAWLQRWYLVCATVLNLCVTFSPSKLEWTAAAQKQWPAINSHLTKSSN